jgi:hypothetical protein
MLLRTWLASRESTFSSCSALMSGDSSLSWERSSLNFARFSCIASPCWSFISRCEVGIRCIKNGSLTGQYHGIKLASCSHLVRGTIQLQCCVLAVGKGEAQQLWLRRRCRFLGPSRRQQPLL